MTATIELTRGYKTIVDDKDSDLQDHKWRAHVDKNCNGVYAVREVTDPTTPTGRTTQRIHRIVMARKLGRDLTKKDEVDHINTNSLDNRRINLRLVTRSQNLQNTPKRRDNTSGYRGVYYHRTSGKWHARIQKDGRVVSLKYHDTPEEAFEAYKEAALDMFGKYAYAGLFEIDPTQG